MFKKLKKNPLVVLALVFIVLGGIVVATTDWSLKTCPFAPLWGVATTETQAFALAKDKSTYVYDVDSSIWLKNTSISTKGLDFTLGYVYFFEHNGQQISVEGDEDEIHTKVNGVFRQVCSNASTYSP